MDEPEQRQGCLRIGLMVVVWFTVWVTIYYLAVALTVGLVVEHLGLTSRVHNVGFFMALIAMAISTIATLLLARQFFYWPTRVLLALSAVALGGIVVLIVRAIMFGGPVSVDNPVGTLQLDELGVAFAADPDGEAERIVGQVWRIEGPKTTSTRFEMRWLFADLGTDEDGVATALRPKFVDDSDEFRFETTEIPIACRIVRVNGPPASQGMTIYAPSHLDDERWIEADSCRVIDPAENQ